MIRQLRTYDKQNQQWVYSGRTPSMVHSFWRWHMYDSSQLDPFEHTGLVDALGTEIYDDDIVEDEYEGRKRLFHFYWNDENACYWAALIHDHKGKNTYSKWKAGALFSPNIRCKVVGNGTENPELLK